MLAVKAVLDFVIVVVFAATYGIGTACSAIAIFVYQGLITLVAHLIGNFVPDSLISRSIECKQIMLLFQTGCLNGNGQINMSRAIFSVFI